MPNIGIRKINLYKLNLSCNDRINYISHMTNLQKLTLCHRCSLPAKEVMRLKLIELNINNNKKIKNCVNNITTLRILKAHNTGLDNKNIKKLNLNELYISEQENIKITNQLMNTKLFVNGQNIFQPYFSLNN